MNNSISSSKRGFSTFGLKVLGTILMFIDHFHEMFEPLGAPGWIDWFGRPVATIFFFVSVVGFSYTHSKKDYMLRLYISMVLMSFLTLILQKVVDYPQVVLINNIFRDLFIGTIFMSGIDMISAGHKQHHIGKIFGGIGVFLIPFFFSAIVVGLMSAPAVIAQNGIKVMLLFTPALVLAENGSMVLLIPMMYLARGKRWLQCVFIAIWAVIQFTAGGTEWMMIFAIIPIMLYNGQKGKGVKYFFYVFYPAHIAILYLISAVIYHAIH